MLFIEYVMVLRCGKTELDEISCGSQEPTYEQIKKILTDKTPGYHVIVEKRYYLQPGGE